MKALDRVKGWFEPHRPVPAGMYHFQSAPDAPQQYRLHLRVEKDGRGVLLINAAKVLHLNQTATEHAKLILESRTPAEAAQHIARRYHVSRETAQADYEQMYNSIMSIAQSGEEC